MTISSFEYRQLTEIQIIDSTSSEVFVNNPVKKSYVRNIILFNGDSTAVVYVKLHKVKSLGGLAGTVKTSNQMYGAYLDPGDRISIEYPIPGSILDELNDTIHAIADVPDVITIEIIGADEDV